MKSKGQKVPTVREVAKAAQVGIMTVSRVLNNHPSVKPSTRKKVEAAIAKLGYQQNEAARLLKGQRAKIIGLIVPDLSDGFFASYADTVQHIARHHGYMTLIASSERDPELELRQAKLMATRMISGLLVASSTANGEDGYKKLQETGLSIVAFDRPIVGVELDSVLVENRTGAEDATRHLIEHGHKNIVCIGYDETVYPIAERIEGYKHAMHSVGLAPHLALSLQTFDQVREWTAKLAAMPKKPTAIFSLNHRTTEFLLQALIEYRVKVPDQVALVGFDDFDLAAVVNPPLTTVAQNAIDLARRSMGLLLERIQHRSDPDYSAAKILLPTRLIVRNSCGSHPAS